MDAVIPADRGGPAQPLLLATGLRKHFPVGGGILGRGRKVVRAVDDLTIEARVWERGAGETASSGTSAVAVAAAFGRPSVRIRFPWGDLDVRFEGRRAFLTGPAERVG